MWPCQSTRIFSPLGLTTSSMTNFTRLYAPLGMAWPTVSQSTIARAPLRMAVLVETFHGVRVGANCVFRDVHGGKTVIDGELHRFFRGAFEMIDGPIFD